MVARSGVNLALQFSENRKRVFDVEYRKKFAADGMSLIIVRPELALAKTSHCVCAAIEKTFVDRNGGRFGRTTHRERMNDAPARAECDRGLLDPALKRSARLIFHHTRREHFRSEREIIAHPHRAADIFDIASQRVRS